MEHSADNQSQRPNRYKALSRLHAWNAWTLLALALTGIALFLPSLRGDVAGVSIRPWIRSLHIAAGILSVLLLALYVPHLPRHWRQLRNRLPGRLNLGLMLALTLGWAASGLLLIYVRELPPSVSQGALWLHDLLTWVGLPWAAYHAISRSRMLRQERRGSREDPQTDVTPPFYARRAFLKRAAGAALLALVGPPFWRWLKSATSFFGGAPADLGALSDANRMLPAPAPLPESLPPAGGGAQGQFRIYTVTPIPTFTSDNWRFEVKGLVDRTASWDWEAFLQLPREVQVNDFHCVTGWSVRQCTWEGVSLKSLLELAGIRPEGRTLIFYSGDGVYTDSLTLEQAEADGVMAAVLLDGRPLSNQLGGPVRLIVPGMYAYKSVKWLQAIEVTDQDHTGYWEARGYEKDAYVKGIRTL